MPYSLSGRNVLITGGSRGLGALVAQKFAAEGSNVAINYVSSKDAAEQVARDIEAQYKVKAELIQGDASSEPSCKRIVQTAIEKLGGLDIVISNAGWTRITTFSDLDAMSDEEWDKCWSVNVKGHFYLFKAAEPTFNANPEGGSFILTSSTAAVSASGSSLAYSVTKAAGLHLMKCLAQSQGSKIRVNAVLPGLMLTDWGQRFSPESIQAMTDRAVLKKVSEIDDIAGMYLTIAKNSSMTGQSIQVGKC
ncbi:hypothetical protein ASPZODRAFT_63773 [Penicilliopsis zonata CBS 506.65]|uniref:Ketoreductase (KR) domain-containing protein n=1 Tax=Penicilliopsis zonata CBS 506.65 TaxID=1073090 RepID=A0A1L9SK55_9EURO|nr:hypothetical protein ASPZODRAFT_63773 [Penicilliopsis zonata CBS 506.65]OJJ47476.1 hypothetical protein ASPZODRAFT_63773 [Penicilliopsis zonata CBS 506.65]